MDYTQYQVDQLEQKVEALSSRIRHIENQMRLIEKLDEIITSRMNILINNTTVKKLLEKEIQNLDIINDAKDINQKINDLQTRMDITSQFISLQTEFDNRIDTITDKILELL